ncbi:MAG: hypothetical protein MJE77_32870 [Proteobacteria bacterium]|nr:hypothetical protein [Pseudomonadota bacterium]
MVGEQLVDVTYRGIVLGRQLRLSPRSDAAHIHTDKPMPMGSEIAISTQGGVAISVRVREVYEKIAGSETEPGMLVTPVAPAGDGQPWWQEPTDREAESDSSSRETTRQGAGDSRAESSAAPATANDIHSQTDEGHETAHETTAETSEKAGALQEAADEAAGDAGEQTGDNRPAASDGRGQLSEAQDREAPPQTDKTAGDTPQIAGAASEAPPATDEAIGEAGQDEIGERIVTGDAASEAGEAASDTGHGATDSDLGEALLASQGSDRDAELQGSTRASEPMSLSRIEQMRAAAMGSGLDPDADVGETQPLATRRAPDATEPAVPQPKGKRGNRRA